MHLEDSLARFHDNKDIFIDLRIHKHFNMPKIHSLMHYSLSIHLFGSTDNYNTEQMKWLHIVLTKYTFATTNKKEENPQMTTRNVCCKKVQVHYSYIKWQQQTKQESEMAKPIGPLCPAAQRLKMLQHPMVKAVSFDDLANKYGAIDFQDMLVDFIAHFNNPMATGVTLFTLAMDTLIPFCSVPVHHRFKFTDLDTSQIVDSIFVWLEQKDVCGHLVPSWFDTVLICSNPASQDMLHRIEGKF
jgi:hypothetical protein